MNLLQMLLSQKMITFLLECRNAFERKTKTCFDRNLSFYPAELFKMVCEANQTDVDISIPVVMLPQDAGVNLEKYLQNNSTGMLFFFANICSALFDN